MAYKHGVYVSEKDTSLSTPIKGYAGPQVIIGTAPINLADDPTSVNNPKICYSFEDAKAAVGYCNDFENYTLCQSISACFKVFNIAPIILINVLDISNSNHVSVIAAASMSKNNNQIAIAVFGVIESTVTVKSSDGSTTYINGTDYLITFDDDGYCLITLISSAAKSATALMVGYSKLNPAGVTAADIIGSVNAETGAEKGLEVIRQIYPKFGLVPGILLAPGWSHNSTIAAALQEKTEKINGCFSCETIIDIDSSLTGAVVYSEVANEKITLGADSKHAIACWPMVKVGSHIYFFSALMGALIAYTDANNNDVPNLSPSNKALKITATCLADGTEVILDQEQANILNSYGIVTALNLNGFKSWGNNTAAYPDIVDPKDRWFAVRRFFSWWGNNFILEYFNRVDNPTDYRLIESIVDAENIRGNSFSARGYCAEAKIKFIADENPITDVLNGKIQFHMYLAPYVPAENIENILEFNPNAIETALTGGEQ